MGRRSEQRIAMRVPILVRGTDNRGIHYELTAETVDIGGTGALLSGLNGVGKTGEKIEIEYKGRKAPFRIQWIGKESTASAGHVGVRCLEPGNYIWGVPLPEWMPDSYEPLAAGYARPDPVEPKSGYGETSSKPTGERRKFPRHACRVEALVAMEGSSMRLPAKVTDISLGGCYLEMLSPLPLDTLVELTLNSGGTTLHAHGKVRMSQTGMGMGVAFTGMSPEDFEKLRALAPPGSSPPEPGTAATPPRAAAAQPKPSLTPVPAAALGRSQNNHPSPAEMLEAVIRLLFRKEILDRAELAEEIEKLMTPKS